jgi:hypothetical protein
MSAPKPCTVCGELVNGFTPGRKGNRNWKCDRCRMIVGQVVWYRTGGFSASKVKILAEHGTGAARSFVVSFLDRAPTQPVAVEYNRHIWPTGGVSIAARMCEPLSPIESELEDVIDAFYENA